METELESGSFLRQIDEIKQELDFGFGNKSSDILDDYTPLNPDMDNINTEVIDENRVIQVLNTDPLDLYQLQSLQDQINSSMEPLLQAKIEIGIKLGMIFGNKGDQSSTAPANLLGEMENLGLKNTKAYKKLFEQVDLLKEAEDRLRSLLDLLSSRDVQINESAELRVKPKSLKLRVVLSKSSQRPHLDRITNEMIFLERLPKNSIFSSINSSYGFVRTKIREVRDLRNKMANFFRRFRKDDFKRLAMRESDEFEKANIEYKQILLEYAKLVIRDEQMENSFWCLESAFKAGLILGRRRRVEVAILEKIYDSLCSPDMKPFGMKQEMKRRLEIVYRIEKWGKRVKAGSSVNFEEMRRALEEFKEICPNILVGDCKEQIENNIGGMQKIMRKLDQPLFLGELKSIRDELKTAPIMGTKTIALIEKRIEMGEDLFLKLRKLQDSDIARHFQELKNDYDLCRVKINKFEEFLQTRKAELHFVENVESIMADESGSLEQIRQIKEKISLFQFCRYCEVELLVVNREVEYLIKEFNLMKEGRQFSEARDNFMARENLSKSDLEGLESELQILRDRVRKEIHYQRMKKSLRPINCTLMQNECEKLQTHLLFLRSLYKDEENMEAIKSGKNSVFEKSLETFLDNYQKNDPVKSKRLRSDILARSEEEKRSLVISKLRRMLEKTSALKVQPADVPYTARSIEQGIYVKLIDKSMYLKVMARIISVIKEIRKNKYVNIGQYIKKEDYRSNIFLKLSQRPPEFLKSLDKKLSAMKQKEQRSTLTSRYLAPFEDRSHPETKIRKRPKELKRRGMKEASLKLLRDHKSSMVDKQDKTSSQNNSQSVSQQSNRSRADSINSAKPATPSPFHFYSIFKGVFRVDLNQMKRNIEMQMFTGIGEKFIKKFSDLPKKMTLVSKLARSDFETYITKALVTQQKNYLVLPGFIGSQSALALKSEMTNRGIVMSTNYSKKSKVFVFPKEFLQSSWLEILNVILIKQPQQTIELLYFIVLKLDTFDKKDKIKPVPLRMENELQPYLLKKNVDKLVEQKLNISKTHKLSEESAKKLLRKRKFNRFAQEFKDDHQLEKRSRNKVVQKKVREKKDNIIKKFDFDEEIRKVSITNQDKKLPFTDSNVDDGLSASNMGKSDTGSQLPKNNSKLSRLFSGGNDPMGMISNVKMSINQDFQGYPGDQSISNTALKQAINIQTMKDFGKTSEPKLSQFPNDDYNEFAFTGTFDNGEGKFDGLFEKHGGSSNFLREETNDQGINQMQDAKFSDDPEDIQRNNLDSEYMDINCQFEDVDPAKNGDVNFVDSFNAVMDQKMKELEENTSEMILDQSNFEDTNGLPQIGSLEGMESKPLQGGEGMMVPLGVQEIPEQSRDGPIGEINEPFKNLTNVPTINSDPNVGFI